jgi:hypothetical protein
MYGEKTEKPAEYRALSEHDESRSSSETDEPLLASPYSFRTRQSRFGPWGAALFTLAILLYSAMLVLVVDKIGKKNRRYGTRFLDCMYIASVMSV